MMSRMVCLTSKLTGGVIMCCDETRANEIRRRTQGFWRARHDLDDYHYYLQCYVEELLPHELRYIEECGQRPNCDLQGKTLVVLVGDSIEPLLISIAQLRPRSVIPVVNRRYSGDVTGQTQYETLCELIQKLPAAYGNTEVEHYGTVLQGTHPHHVFAHLRDQLAGRGDLVIDITGGKKSMVAGAFLYAAYSNAYVSYVDFEEYDPEERRPYGYTCYLAQLENPYEDFALRDWEKVRQLYEAGAYRGAIQMLDQMMPVLESDLFEDEHRQAVAKLRQLLELYDAWDGSAYRRAQGIARNEMFRNIWPALPTILSCLTDEVLNALAGRKATLYQHPVVCYVYANDQLHKARRLMTVSEDYRAALVRAAEVSEFLIKARLALIDPLLRGTDASLRSFRTEDRTLHTDLQILKLHQHLSVRVDLDADSPHLERLRHLAESDFWAGPDCLRIRRNRAIHGVVPVSREDAETAITIAQENIDEFRNWLDEVPARQRYEAITWACVRIVCGLDFVPEVRRR